MGIWDDIFDKAKSLFGNTEQKKTNCYYEMLGVNKDATEDEIKRAYKKMALKWHPDKNPNRLEECTAYFVVLQQAYEVLSDPHERAFYDRHRENIIRGGGSGAGPNEKKDIGIVLDAFFERSCFSGYGDDENGFFAVYRDLFHKISSEEYLYIEEMADRNFPVFGNSKSTYEMIVDPFYSFWMDFSTRRSFAWLDKYNLREAEDRRTLRLMEKENRKLRDLGRTERSKEIQRLVMYVRKLDPRVKAYQKQLAERNRERQKEVDAHRLQVIRQNLEELDEYEVDEETHRDHMRRLAEIDAELDAQFGDLSSTKRAGFDEEAEGVDENGALVSDADVENSYCMVCEKNFKTTKSYSNHVKSKKHRQNVEQLRKHMREEDRAILEELDREQELASESQPSPTTARSKRRKGAKPAASSIDPIEIEKTETAADEYKDATATTTDIEDSFSKSVNLKENDSDHETTTAAVVENKPTKDYDAKEQGKSKKKRRANAASKAAAAANGSAVELKIGPTVPVACECEVCGEEFESRTKLFGHLRDSGHAILKNVHAAVSADAGKKKKAGKKK